MRKLEASGIQRSHNHLQPKIRYHAGRQDCAEHSVDEGVEEHQEKGVVLNT